MSNLLHLMSFRDKQTDGNSSIFTRPGRSGTNQHENKLRPSNCMLLLHCQRQSISDALMEGKPKSILVLFYSFLLGRKEQRWGEDDPRLHQQHRIALTLPGAPRPLQDCSGGVLAPRSPAGKGIPRTRTAWICPRPRFILSTVDILLQFSRDWWEAQEVGGQCVCQYYDKVWWHIL